MADTNEIVQKLGECTQKQDFEGAFGIVRANIAELSQALSDTGIGKALKESTNDRLVVSYVDASGFGVKSAADSLMMLEKLLSFQIGSLVLNDTWGLGKVVRLDYFYRRVTVDFKTKRGHQFSYQAAVDMLSSAPEGHILVLRESDPTRFEALLKEKPADFIKEVLKSYGDLTIVKLEDICVKNGFVKAVNWKKFWDDARATLRADKLVEIPVKRNEPIRLKALVEDYGDGWLTAFSHETDPNLILASVREFTAAKKLSEQSDDTRAKLAERLAFAVTAARKVDDALYAKLAVTVIELGFTSPSAESMRAYLWDRKRYVKAAAELPSREVGAMIDFLACNDEAKAKLYGSLEEFCSSAVSEIVQRLGKEDSCRKAVGELMKRPKAPATLTTLIVGKYEQFKDWKELPSLITLLTHAIALGEGRQGGETLRMQNIIRRLFADVKWLGKMFGWLNEQDQALFFERFQASIAWEASTHHAIVVRMTRIAPFLASHVVKVEKKAELPRVTSYRSYALRKAEYLKLINVDMPENVKKIEFAKSFGDLSENAEYQYAKDEQRQLMQKQTVMQSELEAVKPFDFADATTDKVMPGVMVTVETSDGEKTYAILGEWDNDVEKGVLSSKAKLAVNMLDKKPGDAFEMPASDGTTRQATIKSIGPLTNEIREWMKLPEGMQI